MNCLNFIEELDWFFVVICIGGCEFNGFSSNLYFVVFFCEKCERGVGNLLEFFSVEGFCLLCEFDFCICMVFYMNFFGVIWKGMWE